MTKAQNIDQNLYLQDVLQLVNGVDNEIGVANLVSTDEEGFI